MLTLLIISFIRMPLRKVMTSPPSTPWSLFWPLTRFSITIGDYLNACSWHLPACRDGWPAGLHLSLSGVGTTFCTGSVITPKSWASWSSSFLLLFSLLLHQLLQKPTLKEREWFSAYILQRTDWEFRHSFASSHSKWRYSTSAFPTMRYLESSLPLPRPLPHESFWTSLACKRSMQLTLKYMYYIVVNTHHIYIYIYSF